MKFEKKRIWLQSILASVVAVFFSLFGYMANHAGLSEGVFLLVPFCTGLSIAIMSKGRMVIATTALTSLLLSIAILLFTGFEGIGCVVMALPILLVGIGLGALAGFLIGKKFVSNYGNISVIAFSLAAMTLVGWTNREMGSPVQLQVQTSVNFEAEMPEVWRAVTESGSITGDDTVLRLLGLPVPMSCTLDEDGTRICYF
ncbi:MAG: hypothetical protein ACI8UO_006800, partial [Verrucomicrobiales bacterium]